MIGGKLIDRYSQAIVNHPFTALAMILVLLAGSAFLAKNLKTTSTDYEKMLPPSMDSVEASRYLKAEFGTSTSTATIIMESEPHFSDSNEIRDLRDPEALLYSKKLREKALSMKEVESARSLDQVIERKNQGKVPKNSADIIKIMENTTNTEKREINTIETLTKILSGIEKAKEGMGKTKRGVEGLKKGLNQSAIGIDRLESAVSSIKSGASKLEEISSSKLIQGMEELITGEEKYASNTLSGLNDLEDLVENSNATSTQKKQMLGYIEKLENGTIKKREGTIKALNSLIAGAKKKDKVISSKATLMKEGLARIARRLEDTKKGLEEMKNQSGKLSQSIGKIEKSLGRTITGINQTRTYLDFYVDGKEEEKIKDTTKTYSSYISDDYSLSIIKLSLKDMSESQQKDFAKKIQEMTDEVQSPPGIKTTVAGSPITAQQMGEQVSGTMRKTSLASIVAVLLIVILLFLSIRYGIISLLGISFGMVFALGLIELLGMKISPQSSGAIAMVMGIGIDFGIQIVTRFREEINNSELQRALSRTLKAITKPIMITTVSILIGFRAMALGKLKFLTTFGNILSISVLMCFLAAITIIPVALVINEEYIKEIKRKIKGGEE